MKDISNKLFLCYAWEDIARLQSIHKELEDELCSKISSGIDARNCSNFDDSTSKRIEDAEIFVVFISESAKKSDYVKACVTYALNLNKNILPIEIDKQSLFSSYPEEFRFRSKPYSFIEKNSKAMLFAQLKASLGLNVESGDGFGSLIHVVTDRDANITRYGEQLGVAKASEDHRIRLKKGSHLLTFVDVEDSNLTYSLTYVVESNDSERFLEVPLGKLFKEKQQKEDKEKREAEIKRKFDEENFQKKLLLEQKQRELELKQREEELAIQRQQSAQSAYSTREVDQDVNFFNAIKICLTQKYAKFSGRASRSEYWYFTLFSFIVMVLSSGMDALLGLSWLVLFIPMLAVSVRRLHDIGKSGWYYLIALIPYLGWFVLLYWMCKASDEYTNDYDD